MSKFFAIPVAQAAVIQKQPNNLGLVGYWPLDEGVGTQAGDFSGNGNTGTLAGTTLPTWTTGKRGNALSFNGSGYISMVRKVQDDFTLCSWFKTSGAGVGTNHYQTMSIIGSEWPGLANDFGMGIDSNGKLAFGDGGGSDITFQSAQAVNNNVWHLGCVTRVKSSGAIVIYVDGAQAGNGTGNSSNSLNVNSVIKIGDQDDTPHTLFNGLIDDVRIYNRALSAAEITKLYAQNETNINHIQDTRSATGLVGYWSFNGPDMTTATATDVSGNGHDGTLSGTVKPWPTIGKVGQALNFDGNTSRILVSNAGNAVMPVSNSPFTIALWLNPNSLSCPNICSIMVNESYTVSGFRFAVGSESGNKFQFWTGESGGTISVQSTTVASANNWYHVAVSYNGTTATIYVNGTAQASSTGTYIGNTNNIGIGQSIGGKQYFPGKIDEVRIYNRALSAAEVNQLYLMGK